MQQINYNETNGIIIGPEFSRIFAELILQSVDRIVEQKLVSKHNLKHKVDYEIFRYVDDYFIFFNEDSTKDKMLCAKHTSPPLRQKRSPLSKEKKSDNLVNTLVN